MKDVFVNNDLHDRSPKRKKSMLYDNKRCTVFALTRLSLPEGTWTA